MRKPERSIHSCCFLSYIQGPSRWKENQGKGEVKTEDDQKEELNNLSAALHHLQVKLPFSLPLGRCIDGNIPVHGLQVFFLPFNSTAFMITMIGKN